VRANYPLIAEVFLLYLRDARGEPHSRPRAVSDQQDRSVARSRECRRQQIVDSEVPVSVKSHTIRTVRSSRGGWPAEERSENARPGIRADTIAGCQKQAASLDLDAPFGCHIRIEICDPPWSRRIYTAYNVKVDGPGRGHTGNGNDPDAAPEFQLRIFLGRNDASDRHCYKRYQQSTDHGPRRSAIMKYSTVLAVQIILLMRNG